MFNKKNKQPVRKTEAQDIKPGEFDVYELDQKDESFDLRVVKGGVRRFFAKDDVQTWAAQSYKNSVRENAIDMPEDVVEMISDAKTFVKQLTGVEVDPPVYYYNETDDNNDGLLVSTSGYVVIKKLDVTDDPTNSVTEYMRRMKLTSVLVHEFMHAVDMQRRRVAHMSFKQRGKKRTFTISSIIGNQKYDFRQGNVNGSLGRVGSFFLEGFADWGQHATGSLLTPPAKKEALVMCAVVCNMDGLVCIHDTSIRTRLLTVEITGVVDCRVRHILLKL